MQDRPQHKPKDIRNLVDLNRTACRPAHEGLHETGQRGDDGDDEDEPRAQVDAVPVPVDVLRAAFVQVGDLPAALAYHPVVEDENGGRDGGEDGECGNHTQENGRLGEEAPGLDQDSEDHEEEGTALHGDVAREDAGEIHAGSNVVLGDVDEDLVHVDGEAGEEGCGSTAGCVVGRLDVGEDGEGLPHCGAEVGAGGTGGEDTKEGTESDDDWHGGCRTKDVGVLVLGEASPLNPFVSVSLWNGECWGIHTSAKRSAEPP